jgi:hypothetical protein
MPRNDTAGAHPSVGARSVASVRTDELNDVSSRSESSLLHRAVFQRANAGRAHRQSLGDVAVAVGACDDLQYGPLGVIEGRRCLERWHTRGLTVCGDCGTTPRQCGIDIRAPAPRVSIVKMAKSSIRALVNSDP